MLVQVILVSKVILDFYLVFKILLHKEHIKFYILYGVNFASQLFWHFSLLVTRLQLYNNITNYTMYSVNFAFHLS